MSYDRGNEDNKLFIGGLSWETTQGELEDYFTKFGEISHCTVITDPNTGRSRGYGFVTFQESSAVKDVENEDDHNLGGRKIAPQKARPRGDRPGGRGGGGGSRGGFRGGRGGGGGGRYGDSQQRSSSRYGGGGGGGREDRDGYGSGGGGGGGGGGSSSYGGSRSSYGGGRQW